MTIRQALQLMTKLEEKHGPETQVYFDCPVCRQSFAPMVIDTKAVHLTAAEKP